MLQKRNSTEVILSLGCRLVLLDQPGLPSIELFPQTYTPSQESQLEFVSSYQVSYEVYQVFPRIVCALRLPQLLKVCLP